MEAVQTNAIEVEELSKLFGRFRAVDRVTFSVRAGEIFGFLGPNGAGKSTTIRMLCGLLASSSGTARVGGYDINREPERVRRVIGYMSQKFSLYRDLSLGENVAFFGGLYGLRGARLRERAGSILAMAGLGGMEGELTGTLSGAVQQRLALGCAILHQPPILFLDEPTSGVDPISRRRFWDLIQELARGGVTVLITTHFLDEAEYCSRIGFISAGQLVALSTPAALKREAVGEDLFEVELGVFRGAREVLVGMEGVKACAYFGTRLHLFCEPGAYDVVRLRQAIQGRGLEVRGVEAAAVRLEDVFLRLVQKQGLEAGS